MIEFVAIVLGMIVVILASCLAGERRMCADAQKLHEESERKRREEALTAEGYREMVKDLSDEAIESAAQIDRMEAEIQRCNKVTGDIRCELESARALSGDLADQVNRLSAELLAAQASIAKEIEKNNYLIVKFREKDIEAAQANRLRSAVEERLNELLGKVDLLSNEREELRKEIAKEAETNKRLAMQIEEAKAVFLEWAEK